MQWGEMDFCVAPLRYYTSATRSHSLYKEQFNEILLRQPETMLIDCYNVNTLSAIANTRVRCDIRRFYMHRTLFPLYAVHSGAICDL